MSTKTYEPKYQCWVEKDFLADRAVMRMTPTQRHFYRALLQAAFNVNTRPYLPADDNELWQIADADSIEQWQENKASILTKFQPFTADDGTELWSHKRILSDWGQALDYVEKKRTGGLARQQKSAPTERVAAPALKPKTKVKEKEEKERESETDTEPVPVSGAARERISTTTELSTLSCSPGTDGSVSVPVQDAIADIGRAWNSLYSTPAKSADIANLIGQFYANDACKAKAELPALLAWNERHSNFWGPADGTIRNTAGLLRNFSEMRRQWTVYMEKARAGAEEKEANRQVREIFAKNAAKPKDDPAPAAGPDDDVDEDFGTLEIDEDALED